MCGDFRVWCTRSGECGGSVRRCSTSTGVCAAEQQAVGGSALLLGCDAGRGLRMLLRPLQPCTNSRALTKGLLACDGTRSQQAQQQDAAGDARGHHGSGLQDEGGTREPVRCRTCMHGASCASDRFASCCITWVLQVSEPGPGPGGAHWRRPPPPNPGRAPPPGSALTRHRCCGGPGWTGGGLQQGACARDRRQVRGVQTPAGSASLCVD